MLQMRVAGRVLFSKLSRTLGEAGRKNEEEDARGPQPDGLISQSFLSLPAGSESRLWELMELTPSGGPKVGVRSPPWVQARREHVFHRQLKNSSKTK